jgi:hypothetical protein
MCNMSLFRSIALPLLLASSLAAQTPPTRQVHGDTLVSPADPAASLIVAPAFRYAGGQVIDILKVAGAEQYFFIDAAPDSAIRRFYWIQFEYFYPDNSHAYNYSGIKGQKPVMLGRLDFAGDIRRGPNYFTDDDRPGSDSKAAEEFLRAKGFRIGGTFITLRMFHLPDATRRRELMIIYGEALPDSAAEQRIRADITAHAQANIRIP